MNRRVFFSLVISLLLINACSDNSSKKFTAYSNSFNSGDFIPKKYAKEGDNISPSILWKNIPKNTKYIAVVMDDTDAKEHANKTWSHWFVYNIDVNKTKELKEGIKCPLPDIEAMGFNSWNNRGYDGPNPPKNDTKHKYHTYTFGVYALKNAIPDDDYVEMTNEKFKNKFKNIIIESSFFTGKYKRN